MSIKSFFSFIKELYFRYRLSPVDYARYCGVTVGEIVLLILGSGEPNHIS